MAETQTQEAPQQDQATEQRTELGKPQPQQQQKTVIQRGDRGVELKSFGELLNYARCIAASHLAPKGFETPEQILVAIEAGAEVGLRPLQALQNIAVINGRPSFYGDVPLAIVQASGELEDFQEFFQGDGGNLTAVCVSKRRGRSKPCTRTFSVSDAQTAGLWGKAGPWKQYPKRMLQMRARGFNLRDEFPDILKGFCSEIHPDEVIDTVPQADGHGGTVYASRSDALAAQMESAASGAKDQQPPTPTASESDLPGPDEVPAPQRPQNSPSDPNAMTESEKLVLELSEVAKCTPAAARLKLESICPKFYQGARLDGLTPKQIDDLRGMIRKGSIHP